MYEINVPSCRGIHFLDQDQIIVLEDGESNVFVCSIAMQKRMFEDRLISNRQDDIKTVKYEDQEYFGMGEEDNVHYVRQMKKENDEEDADLDDLKDTAGVKTIRL